MDGRMDALALTQIHWGMGLSSMVIITSRGQQTIINSRCLRGTAGQRKKTFFPLQLRTSLALHWRYEMKNV